MVGTRRCFRCWSAQWWRLCCWRSCGTCARAGEELPNFDGTFGDRDGLALSNGRFLHERGDHGRRFETWGQFAGFVEKLLSPAQVALEHFLKLSAGGDLNDLFVELIRGAESPGVPGGNFAKHSATEFFTENVDHKVQVAAHDAHTIFKPCFGWQLAGAQKLKRVSKNPGIVKGSASDADASTAGIGQHFASGFR